MNYRHIYHAGNACDVVKHAVLAKLVLQYHAKESPFCVLDTHAGIGLYDLNDPRAQKTGEAQHGIYHLLGKTLSSELTDYINVIRSINNGEDGPLYPGSPRLVRQLLRPQDKLIACELHPEDVHELKKLFKNDGQTAVHNRDGYEAIRALLPPEQKRGIIFIDPPFEQTSEFQQIIEAINVVSQKWHQACMTIWYPIKERPSIWRFHEALEKTSPSKILCAEFMFSDESRSDILNGSGLILINPPWKFEKDIEKIFGSLKQRLKMESHEASVKWIKQDKIG